jgi:hypothetical protein
VPEITPEELFSVNPAGNDDPEAMENVYEPFPPVADMVAEYTDPTVALAAEQGPQSRLIGDPITTMVHVAVSDFPFASTTFVVNT